MNKRFSFAQRTVARTEPASRRHRSDASWLIGSIMLLGGFVLLTSGCASDAFLPAPENLPYGESQSDAASPQPLQPPTDL